MGLITISTAFQVMQNIIEQHSVIKQPNKTKDLLISMGFRQTSFWKQDILCPMYVRFSSQCDKKIQFMPEKLRAFQMVKESPALRVSSSQRVSFCAISVRLNLSKTVKADKPNFYLHTLFFYYIFLYYLVSTQTEKNNYNNKTGHKLIATVGVSVC